MLRFLNLLTVYYMYLKKQETQHKQMRNSANFPDVFSNYYFEYHTGFQNRKLKSKSVTFNYGFSGEYKKKKKHKNEKCDVNIKIKNIRTRPFRISVLMSTLQISQIR